MSGVEFMPIFMFLALAILLFSGYPVAWVLGGVGVIFGAIGILFGVFNFIEYFNIVSRLWGNAAESLILVAVPMFPLIVQVGRLQHVAERSLGDRLAGVAGECRFGVERFEMAGTADHEQPDHMFRLRREVRQAGGLRTTGLRRSRISIEHGSQSDTAESQSHVLQERASPDGVRIGFEKRFAHRSPLMK